MSPSFREIQLEIFNKDLEKLKKDYEAVAEKKRRESNPVEKNNLESQLDSIVKEIKEIEQKYEEKKIKDLQEILSQFKAIEEISVVKNAYHACKPEDWYYNSTDKPEEILADVLKMGQGDSKYTKIEHFVTCLLILTENKSLITKLKIWAKEYINEFDDLLKREKQEVEKKPQENTNSYLLIVLEKSNQDSASKNSDYYHIQASTFIEYINDNPQIIFDSHRQMTDEIDNQTFTIDKIPDILNQILNEGIDYNSDFYGNLTIEIFLPFDLLNHPVDYWEFKDGTEEFLLVDSVKKTVGQEYKVVVRCYERWKKLYKKNQYRYSWENNWKKRENFSFKVLSIGSDEILNEIFGLKIAKPYAKNDTFFVNIIKSAIPVALWLRENPPDLNCQSQIKQFLNSCSCIDDLPVTLKDKRTKAKDPNTDIGYHISLLWEDPYRLPPDINYSMPN